MKQFSAILLVVLLASSWCASYFTLRLIDNVVVQNKLSVNEINRSLQVTKSLGISKDILLKQTDVSYKLSLGYAAPFILEHNNDFYEVMEKPVNVVMSTSILKFVRVADSEKDEVAYIVNNMFQTYVNPSGDFILNKYLVFSELNVLFDSNDNYSNALSVAVPPPRA
ncbi:hypothetical protein [Fulvivirga sp.]|uniref:hypothetical protein n=1 Tax=Fulvivirga sp. TaxID=1931237 RepID=UPI0032EAB717